MKRLLITLGLLMTAVLALALVAPHAYAVDVLDKACNNSNATSTPTVCADNHPNGDNPFFGPTGVVTKGIQLFAMIIGVTSVIVIIVYGLRFMTSMGDPNSVATARRAIIYAIVGLVIAGLAQLIVSFVLARV